MVPNFPMPNNVQPPYIKGRKMDLGQKSRIFDSPKKPIKPMKPATKASPPTVSSGNPPTFNKKSAFKAGFLNYIAEQGRTPNEYFQHVKQAFLPDPGALISSGLQGVGEAREIALDALKGGAIAGVAAPLVAGAATGGLREFLSTPSPENPEVLRKLERIGLYRRLAAEIRARNKNRV